MGIGTEHYQCLILHLVVGKRALLETSFGKIKNHNKNGKNKIINDIDIFKESAYRKYKNIFQSEYFYFDGSSLGGFNV